MEMPRVTDAHRKLEKLVGNWVGEEKISPSPFDPKGGTSIGRVTNRAALDGFAVVQDYEQERDGKISFRGHGVFCYKPRENQYYMYWFDSMGMGPNDYRGSFDGDVLTLNYTSQIGMGHGRAIFDLREANRYTFRLDVSPDSKTWHTFLEGKYTRK